MVVNFRAREISRGTRKLAGSPILNKKKKDTEIYSSSATEYLVHVNRTQQNDIHSHYPTRLACVHFLLFCMAEFRN